MELMDSWFIIVRWFRWSYWTAGVSVFDSSDGAAGQFAY